MIAVIFEVEPKEEGKEEYLTIAAELKTSLESITGFISVERFESLTNPSRILSLSFWEDENAVKTWRNQIEHRRAQKRGKDYLFDYYRIRVAEVVCDYSIKKNPT
ncbi:antibiotic biosynthesis monooxygenase family protein [Spartinivicinus ruber]|uniref:antibiotic biosynthesis monooxygenase family protein n=1 Tax=Spartinivicinus ruber TaxID=2683272 RepID=UPI0013D10C21|nr:antibiotic biosynthesis monooxygenase [Spartinivicinus ruber]